MKKVGKRVKIIAGNDYFGLEGSITYCKKCCRAYRIQFDNIGNSEKLKYFRKSIVYLN